MAQLPLLAERLLGRCHYVTPSYAAAVIQTLSGRLGVRMDGPEVDPTLRPARSPMMASGVFVLPIVGGLMHRGDSFDAACGAQSYVNIQNQLVLAMTSKEVKGILLDIDSPGGMASGCFELADMISDMRKRKPIWAIANAQACSAAYAIGISADRLVVTPSGEVGSIGVVRAHVDHSKALSEAGLAVTYIYAGEHKIDGNPANPLPPAVIERFQADVDESYAAFVAHVAKHRDLSETKIRGTKALTFAAEQAVEMGLADEVASFDATLSAFSRELNPVYRVSSTGAVSKMTTQTQAGGPTIEGLGDALQRAREDGAASARAEANAAILAAYQRGRTDAHAILTHEASAGKTAAAMRLAGRPEVSVETAVSLLGDLPAADDGANAYRAKLANADPKVPAGAPLNPNATVQATVGDFQAQVGAHLRTLIPGVKQKG